MLVFSDNSIFYYSEHEEATATYVQLYMLQYKSGGNGTDCGH